MMINKKMAIIALVFFFSLLSSKSFAQFLDLKGVTVKAISTESIVDGENIPGTCDMIFNVSLADKILVHNVFEDGYISASQIYSLSDVEKYTEQENTVFKFTAISGVSGNSFYYKITINKEGKLSSLILTQMDKSTVSYFGSVSALRTLKQ